jgi:hypothetical protein
MKLHFTPDVLPTSRRLVERRTGPEGQRLRTERVHEVDEVTAGRPAPEEGGR